MYVLITEYLNGETLENYTKNNQIHEDLALEIVQSILEGLNNTHMNSFSLTKYSFFDFLKIASRYFTEFIPLIWF